MRFAKHISSLALIGAVLAALSVQSTQAGKPGGGGGGNSGGYTLVRLAPPDLTLQESHAFDVNDSGNVVGTYQASEGSGSYSYRQMSGQYQLLGAGVSAYGLNNLGAIVGSDGTLGIGLYWSSPTAAPTQLLPLLGHTGSRAYRVNNDRIVVGQSYGTNSHVTVAWRINAQGIASDPIALPFLPGDERGTVTDVTEQVNGISTVVGYTGDLSTFPRSAVQWSVFVDSGGNLSLLSGPTQLSRDYAAAYGINAAGDVVGAASLDAGPPWPFIMSPGLPLWPLAGLPKATWGHAVGINDDGKIVGTQGYLARGAPIDRAVLWTTPSTVIDLNSKVSLAKGEVLVSASRINSRGDIIASSEIAADATRPRAILLIAN